MGQIQYSEKYFDDTYEYRGMLFSPLKWPNFSPRIAYSLKYFFRCEDLLKLSFKISCSISLFCLYLMQARSIMERYLQHQREKWTEEEHQRFLEALRLYGRGWRQIEEHVGTKSADQIRSHAQKFFSKVVRESNGGFDGSIKPVVIPPPRLKRKQVHPYPRKSVDLVKGIFISSLINLNNQC
ncbi:hypothetical protein GOBAR_AA34389 [Gossypium barbadense]|uniref:Uncharacterized protein n=1 Tax=Gossypium barbadense TaxID=3634 RepID=A0A2P5W5B6_GOSBA|nr:hypothetical protein GOBAR_AA34389 [Gossypium barbadense]